MKHEEKIQYMDMAASLCHFHLKEEHLDLVVSLYELIVKKKGNANLHDVATVQAAVKGRAIDREKEDKNKEVIEISIPETP